MLTVKTVHMKYVDLIKSISFAYNTVYCSNKKEKVYAVASFLFFHEMYD